MAAVPTDKQSSGLNIPPSRVTLSAIYNNESTSIRSYHHFSHPLSTPVHGEDSSSMSKKANYLAELRTSVKTLQDELNFFLTRRMEEDKLHSVAGRDGPQGQKAGERTMDEVEEEKYGEEDVDNNQDG